MDPALRSGNYAAKQSRAAHQICHRNRLLELS